MRLINYITSIAVVVCALLIIISCSKQETPTETPNKENHAPKIVSVSANPSTMNINYEAELTCSATDEDGDSLKITWSCEKGTLPNGNSGKVIKYKSPSSVGVDIIHVEVSDEKLTTKDKIQIEITEKPNHGPVITHLFFDNGSNPQDSIYVGQEVGLVCFAKDEDNDPLTISWTCKKGTLVDWFGGTKKYRADNFRGKDTVFVVVSDGREIYTGKIIMYVTPYPSKPSLTYPQSHQTNISIPPTLSWSSYNAESYTLQISKDYGFSSYIYNESGLKGTTKQIDGLEIGTIYNWHVKAKNKYGESIWSYTYLFTTVAPPSPPALDKPVNNAINIGLFPVLSWKKDELASSYCLQISTNSNFTELVYDKCGLTSFIEQITDLRDDVTYYWRMNAKNEYGYSAYSTVNKFTTGKNFTTGGACEGAAYVYYGGKIYNTVKIGDQCWLKENLDVGTMITSSQKSSDNNLIEKRCYDNNSENCYKFGGIYTWNEAMQYKTQEGSRGICPEGFHIPTKADFENLIINVNVNGNSLKALGSDGDNASGFNAILSWTYNSFWSSTEDGIPDAYFMTLHGYHSSYIKIGYGITKEEYYGIRCIRDK